MTDDDLNELFLERAAIMEYDAGLPRVHATFNAARDIRRLYGKLPDSVKQECDRVMEEWNGRKN